MNTKYFYRVSKDKQACAIFLLSPYKYVGTVIRARGKRSIQEFAPGVTWLPVHSAMEAMGAISKEESILGQLGV